MKLLSVIPVMGIGGAEAVAAALTTDAHRRGHQVHLGSAGGFRVPDVTSAGVAHLDLSLIGRSPVDLGRSVRLLRAHCRSDRPDLVHAHNVKAALVGRLAIGRSGRVLATLHGVPADELRTAARVLGRTADHVVAVSPHVAEQLQSCGYPAERISVIENSIPPLRRHDRHQVRAELGIAPDAPVALCLARMSEQKRHDLLVEAWAGMPSDAVLLLAGDGPTRPAVEALSGRLGLHDRVRLLGERSDADRLLSATDVLVLPTDWEGLPISLLEGMSLAVPVVVSRVGGVVETLGSAVHLVEPGSVPALCAALAELLADPDRRAALGRRGQQLVATHYGPERMLDAYADLYSELTPRRSR